VSISVVGPRAWMGISTGHKFAERRRRVASATFGVVRDVDLLDLHLQCPLPEPALGLPRHQAFLPHGATLAGRLTSAVDDLSVPRVEQEPHAPSLEP
jgi:hypothetical protein